MGINRRKLLGLTPVIGAGPWTRTFGARNDRGDARLLQGPMVGAPEAHRLRIWMRASDQYNLAIDYAKAASPGTIYRSRPVSATPDNDYCAVVTIDDLEPGTEYHYRVVLDGKADDELAKLPSFTTRTAPAGPKEFTVAFGSCARYARDPVQPIWRAIDLQDPDLFFWLGDNIYADTRNPQTVNEEYRRQRDVQLYRPLGSRIPQLAIWDDHDFGLNDHDRTNPIKEQTLKTHRQYWANPAYGLPEAPGVFFSYAYGGVDFFFLDGRYYRDPNAVPDSANKTMLGTAQLDWLKRELVNSTAPFKVLACGSGWSKAKGPGGDSWASFVHERNALFRFLRDEAIEGVVLLSGDTHVAELNCIPWSAHGGYDLYDLTSSPLAQNTTDSWRTRKPELRIRPVFFGSPNYGLLRFSATPEPTLTFNVMDVAGRPVWAPLSLSASQLKNGVESWREHVTPDLLTQPLSALPFETEAG